MSTIQDLQRRIGEVNVANGWRADGSAENPTPEKAITMFALIMSEVAEAIERGARSVYPGEASPLAEALGVSLGELLAGVDGGPVGVGVVS